MRRNGTSCFGICPKTIFQRKACDRIAVWPWFHWSRIEKINNMLYLITYPVKDQWRTTRLVMSRNAEDSCLSTVRYLNKSSPPLQWIAIVHLNTFSRFCTRQLLFIPKSIDIIHCSLLRGLLLFAQALFAHKAAQYSDELSGVVHKVFAPPRDI